MITYVTKSINHSGLLSNHVKTITITIIILHWTLSFLVLLTDVDDNIYRCSQSLHVYTHMNTRDRLIIIIINPLAKTNIEARSWHNRSRWIKLNWIKLNRIECMAKILLQSKRFYSANLYIWIFIHSFCSIKSIDWSIHFSTNYNFERWWWWL